MTEIKKEQNVNLQLKTIELLEVQLKHPEIQLPQNTMFKFNINLEHKINLDNNLVILVSNIDVLNNDKETQLASLKASCIFEIPNLKDYFKEKTSHVLLPDEVMTILNSISISTVRGIMFSQFKGTFLHNAVLPIIDPKSFVKNSK